MTPARRAAPLILAALAAFAAAAAAAPAPPPHPPDWPIVEPAASGAADAALEAALATPAGRRASPQPPPQPPIDETPPAPPAAASGAWARLAPPAGRYGHVVVLDPVRRRLVLFGGSSLGATYDDVWVRKLGGDDEWRALEPAGPGPSARHGASGVYDPVGDRILVYGGYANGRYWNDVWELSLEGDGAWRLLGLGPSPRAYAAVVLDSRRHRLLIHGGFDDQPRSDLWSVGLAEPLVVSPIGPLAIEPAARTQHAAIYDEATDRLIVHGGQRGAILGDAWALKLDGGPQWSPLASPGVTPSPRYGHAVAFDVARRRMVVFGGYDELDAYRADAWSLDLDTHGWTELHLGTPPGSRVYHGMVHDAESDRLVVFGGFSTYGRSMNDLWSLGLTTETAWRELDPSGSVPARTYPAVAFDEALERLHIHGGSDATRPAELSDAWTLVLGDRPRWLGLVPTGVAPRLRHHGLVYDPVRRRLVVFGGYDGVRVRNDVWTLTLAGPPEWRRETVAGEGPVARALHTAVLDAVRRRVIVFGGVASIELNDVWALQLDGPPAWTRLAASGSATSARSGHMAVVDTRRDRMIALGGTISGVPRTDVVALALTPGGGWSRIVPAGTPPPAAYHRTGVYDARRDRVVFVQSDVQGVDNEVWAIELEGGPVWRRLAPVGRGPGYRYRMEAAYDLVRDRMILFGGSRADNTVLNDAWALDFGRGTVASAPPEAPADAPGDALVSTPNPASRHTAFTVRLAADAPARLEVLDLAGRAVRTLDAAAHGSGSRRIEWDLRDATGARVPPGVYLVRLSAGATRAVRRIAVLP